MATKFLDKTGLSHFWSKIKAWALATFAAITHNHASSAVNAMTGYSKPNSTSAIATSDTLNQAIGKLEKAVDDADISNVVHKTGDETVQGTKIFNNERVYLKSNFDDDTTPAEDVFIGYDFIDAGGNRLGSLEYSLRDSSNVSLCDLKIMCCNPSNETDFSYLHVGFDKAGNKFAVCSPTSDLRSDDRDILTRNWIPKDVRIVHTTGNETINGNKTFTNAIYCPYYNITIPNLKLDANNPTLPSSSYYRNINYLDVNNTKLAHIQYACYTNGSTKLGFGLWNMTGSQSASLDLHVDADGKVYATAPDPTSFSMDSTQIATTYWVRRATGNFALNAATATKATNDSAGNNISNTYVKKTGDTLSGNLRFVATNAGVTHECLITMNSDSLNFGLYDSTNSHWILISNADRSWSMFYGDISGTAAAAAKLATARTIRTNLASTSTASFDGSANITPGVTGTLPVANGGTGLTSLDTFVRTTGNQTVGGEKKFTTSLVVERVNPYLFLRETDVDRTTNSAGYSAVVFQDKNGKNTGDVICIQEAASASPNIPLNGIELRCFAHGVTDNSRYIGFLHDGSNDVWSFQTRGGYNNIRLGNGGNRFSQLYAMTATIDTSDERMKSDIQSIPEEVLDAWDDIEWYAFKMNDAVAEKGIDKARIHSGLVAQRIASVFDKHSIDAFKYSFICYDSWEGKPAIYDKDGKVISPEEKAGDEYSLRYTEALCIEAAYQRRKNKILENRISELEKRLAKLEGIV